MALVLSSSFSINMLPIAEASRAEFHPIDLEEARSLIAEFDETKNMVNPRHESTAKFSQELCGKPAEGGFLSIDGGQKAVILVMLPPRSRKTRSGVEVEVKGLEEFQYFEVRVN